MPGPDANPQRLGKFEIVRRIGVGGMAEVYEALLHGAQGFKKRLALKTLLPGMREDPHVIDMFIDEATIVARLEHRNIVNVYEFGEIDGTYYLAMEYIDGPTLRGVQRRLQEGDEHFPIAAAACCVREICLALEYIHGAEQQIVHRDVTPQNVFIDRRGVVKLADFGIAKTAARRSQTASGQIKGKLRYLAPEQVTEEKVTPQTDVYAAGLILFELLTGEPLIDGNREVDVIRAAMNPPVRPPSKLRPDAAQLDRIVLTALEKHPSLRYPNAKILGADLDRYLATQPQPADERMRRLLVLAGQASAPPHPEGQPLGGLGPLKAAPSISMTPGTPVLPPVAARQEALQAHPPEKPGRLLRWTIPLAVLVVALVVTAALSLGPGSDDPAQAGTADAAVASAPDAAHADGSAIAAVDARSPVPDLTSAVARPIDAAATARRSRRGKPRRTRGRSRSTTVAAKNSKTTDSSKPDKPPTGPVEPAQPDLAQLRRRLSTLVAAARSRGLYPGDEPELDRLMAATRQQIATGSAAEAGRSLERLDQRIRAFQADRAFADRKLARLSAAIRRARLSDSKRRAMERLSQEILQLIIARKYVQASRAMSRAKSRLREASR